MISPNQLVYRLTPDIQDVEGYHIIHYQNDYKHVSQLDDATIAFGHKLGVVVESEYTLKVSIDGEEDVYFIIPMEVKNE